VSGPIKGAVSLYCAIRAAQKKGMLGEWGITYYNKTDRKNSVRIYGKRRETMTMKRKTAFVCVALAAIAAASVLWLKWDAIFQRGNPIPYLLAASRLSKEKTYAVVNDGEGIYISKAEDHHQLFADFEQRNGVTFVEQAGNGYLFSDGEKKFVLSSEIYWGRYKVWVVP